MLIKAKLLSFKLMVAKTRKPIKKARTNEKKELLNQIKEKYTVEELLKISEKNELKVKASMNKAALLKKIETLSKEKLEEMAKKEEGIIISLKPSKWMIPAVGLIITLVVYYSLTTGSSNTITSGIILTYLTDASCQTCYNVTINEQILTQQYGLTLTTKTYDINSNEGKALISKYDIEKVPTFILTGSELTSETDLINVWAGVGTVENDGAMVFRAPEAISTDFSFKIRDATTGAFIMFEPPETTIGNFMIMEEDVCTENGKPIVYFFGSTSCPHCVWEKPVIGNTTALFASEISYHENMGTQTDLEVFQRYATYNRGSVPFIVIGCQFIRLGSGESMAADEATIKELNKTNPAIISESLSLYDEAISYSELAITAYQNNETIYLDYLDNYTALLQQSSEAIEKLVLTKLICNVTNNMPSSVCNI